MEWPTRRRATIRIGAPQRTCDHDIETDRLRRDEGHPTEYALKVPNEGERGFQPHGNGTKKAGKR